MANNMSTYLSNKLLGHSWGQAAYTMPTAYAALSTTAVTMPAATGATEPSGGAYARVAISSNMGAPASEQIANSSAISFAQATASWGTVTWLVIFDAATGGNVLWAGPLSSSATIAAGDTFTIPSGSLTDSLS